MRTGGLSRPARRFLPSLLAVVFCLGPATIAEARDRIFGWCEQGGQTVTTAGLSSTSTVQGSFPGCTVTVFDAGTVDIASIFSDNVGTGKANPFTADLTTGFWFFYADNSRYDVQLSGGGIPAPFTLTDVQTTDGQGGIFSTVAFSATPVFDLSIGDIFEITLTGNVTSSTITNPSTSKKITIIVKQDGTGGRTFVWPTDTVRRLALVDTNANAVTVVSYFYDGANWEELDTSGLSLDTINPANINGVIWVDGVKHTDIEAAYDVLTTGGEAQVPPGTFTFSDTIDLDVTDTALDFADGVQLTYTGTGGCAIEITAGSANIFGFPDIEITSTDPSANNVCLGGPQNANHGHIIELGKLTSTNALAVSLQAEILASGSSGAVRAGCPGSCVVTITTATAHGLLATDNIRVYSVVDGTFDGAFTVASVPTSTTLTYTQTAAQAATGDVTSGSGWISTLSITAAPNGAVRTGCPGSCVTTIETTRAHGLVVGDYVYVAGVTDTTFIGVHKIVTVPISTTFTFTDSFVESNATSGSGTIEMGQYGLAIAQGGLNSKFTVKGCRDLDACVFAGLPGGGHNISVQTVQGGNTDINAVLRFGGKSGNTQFYVSAVGGGGGGAEVLNGVLVGGFTQRVYGYSYFEDGAGIGKNVTYRDTAANNKIVNAHNAGSIKAACTSTGDDNVYWDLNQGAIIDACDSELAWGGILTSSQVNFIAREPLDDSNLVNNPQIYSPDLDLKKLGGSVSKDHTALNTSSSGVWEDLHVFSVPANGLGRSGGLRITASGTITGTVSDKRFRLLWGGGLVVNCVLLNAADEGEWSLTAVILSQSDTANQRTSGVGHFNASTGGTALVCSDTNNLVKDTTTILDVQIQGWVTNAADNVLNSLLIVETF